MLPQIALMQVTKIWLLGANKNQGCGYDSLCSFALISPYYSSMWKMILCNLSINDRLMDTQNIVHLQMIC